MSNKKIATIISLFIIGMFLIIGVIAIGSHIPFVGRAIALIFAVLLIAFVLIFIVLATKRSNK